MSIRYSQAVVHTNAKSARGKHSRTPSAPPAIMPLCHLRPNAAQLSGQFAIGHVRGVLACQNHDVDIRKRSTVASKGFTNDALDTIAVNGSRNPSLGQCQAKTRRVTRTGRDNNDQTGANITVAPCKHGPEFLRLVQPRSRRKMRFCHGCATRSWRLRRQTLAALGTAGADDRTSAASGHAGTETVGALATYIAWLKGSLHDLLFPGASAPDA